MAFCGRRSRRCFNGESCWLCQIDYVASKNIWQDEVNDTCLVCEKPWATTARPPTTETVYYEGFNWKPSRASVEILRQLQTLESGGYYSHRTG